MKESGFIRRPRQKAPGVRMRVGQYRLSPDIAARVRSGHPWVFRDALGSRGVTEPTGAVVELISGNQEFVGRGYVDQEHAIAVRVLTRDPGERVVPGSGVVGVRFSRALQLRWILWAGRPLPSAMRLFSGESEGLPGVTVDWFGESVVVQWLSQGALGWREELYDAIEATAKPRGIDEQRRFRPLAGQAPPEPAVRARGDEAPLEVIVEDSGLPLRRRPDRSAGRGPVPGHAARLGGGRGARQRAALLEPVLVHRSVLRVRGQGGRARGDGRRFRGQGPRAGAAQLRAFGARPREDGVGERRRDQDGEKFASRGRKFDVIVCDPPTFSHGPAGQFNVTRNLAQVAAVALPVLEPGGILAFATNSTKVSAADLDRALGDGAAMARTDLRVFQRVGLPADYPVAPGFPEGNYLKLALAVRA